MAKSERPQGKRGETHYNRKEGSPAKGGFRKSADRRDGAFRPSGSEEKPANKREQAGRKNYRNDDKRRPHNPADSKKQFRSRSEEKPFDRRDADSRRPESGERKPYRKPAHEGDSSDRKPARRFPDADAKKTFGGRQKNADAGEKKGGFRQRDEKPFRPKDGQDRNGGRAYEKKPLRKSSYSKPKDRFDSEEFAAHSNPAKPGKWDANAKTGPMTLNKYLAHAGISSRRDAAGMIKEGKVQVNGKTLTEPGYRVQPKDKVTMDGKELKPQKHFVYVLLNKPKDFLTTTEDDRGRRTVMELVSGATEDRLYPVGRLDRNTTGVLLLTNDGDLAQKLSHPKYECKKIYQVSLDKDLTKRDFDQIIEGVNLEDGLATVDRLAYLDKKSEIGLEIHSGRNRIVRRIFEHLGYNVEKLDRVMYAGLTKKNVSRGKWRFLSEKEVITLKHFRT